MNYDLAPTICATVVAIFAIQGVTIYAVAKLVILGRPLAEKREPQQDGDERQGRIVTPWSGNR